MVTVSTKDVLNAANQKLNSVQKGTNSLLRDASRYASSLSTYDVFLSHSKMDDKYVLGAKIILEQKGLSVYVDWIDDPLFDRSNVNAETAENIRKRMRQCRLMFYLHTNNASLSKWCPWELGYFDGQTKSGRRTFVFPLRPDGQAYQGQEYLELYPKVDIDNVGKIGKPKEDVWGEFQNEKFRFRRMDTILKEAG